VQQPCLPSDLTATSPPTCAQLHPTHSTPPPLLWLPAGHASASPGSAAYPADDSAYQPLHNHHHLLLQQPEPSFDLLEEYGLPRQATAVAVGEHWLGQLASPAAVHAFCQGCYMAMAQLLCQRSNSVAVFSSLRACQPVCPIPLPAGCPMPRITVRPPAGGLFRRAASPPAAAPPPPAYAAAVMPPPVLVPAHTYSRAQLLAAELGEANDILSAVEVPGQRQAALSVAHGLAPRLPAGICRPHAPSVALLPRAAVFTLPAALSPASALPACLLAEGRPYIRLHQECAIIPLATGAPRMPLYTFECRSLRMAVASSIWQQHQPPAAATLAVSLRDAPPLPLPLPLIMPPLPVLPRCLHCLQPMASHPSPSPWELPTSSA
jgi:hypothetical protein